MISAIVELLIYPLKIGAITAIETARLKNRRSVVEKLSY